MNYPEGAKRNDLRCFLTVSKVQLITLERSASGKIFRNFGPAWAKALFCIVNVLTLGTFVPDTRYTTRKCYQG